jgi:hypothetical protein
MYAYNRLPSSDSFRVLELLPSIFGKLQCRLRIVSLNKPLNYEAISYVWGNPTNKVDLICDGGHVSITRNLYNALCHLRHHASRRWLWVDAVCIDQSNLEERSAQVTLLKSIFAKARRVLSWLGPEDERDADALLLIEKIGRVCCEAHSITLEEVARTSHLDNFVVDLGPNFFWLRDHRLPSWLSFFRFFELPYFCRVWIAQELQSNQKIRAICGKVEIDFGYIALAATWVKYADYKIFCQMVTDRGIGNLIHIRKLHTFENSLLGRLHGTRGLFASDPRDKVFAFAGNSIPVDYTKSTLDVFQDVAVILLNEHGYDCLSYVVHRDHIEYPSWVPKFDYSFIVPLRRSPGLAAGGGRFKSLWKVKRRSIFLHAVRVDTVSMVEKLIAWSSFDVSHDYKTVSPEFIKMWQHYTVGSEASAPYLAGCTLRTAFSLTLTAGLQRWVASGGINCHQQAFEEYAGRFTENLVANKDDVGTSAHDADEFSVYSYEMDFSTDISFHSAPPEPLHPDIPSVNKFSPHGATLWSNRNWWSFYEDAKWPHYQRDAQSISNNRRIFRTDEGYLGLGPKLTRGVLPCQKDSLNANRMKPDELWVVPGAMTPFILRPKGGCYQLVGECYVYGLMDGEAMSGIGDDRFKVEEIEVV